MTSVGEHIQHTNKAICENISQLGDRRGILSQNILAQLRNLVEGTAVLLCTGSAEAEYDYERIKEGWSSFGPKGNMGSWADSTSICRPVLPTTRWMVTPLNV